MEFTISGHARRRMRQRGITNEMIRRTLEHPDRIRMDRDDPEAMHRLKRWGDTVVCVVYNYLRQPWHVVTVFLERSLRRRKRR